jgi:flavin-dependent dehydrogenase
MTYCDEGWAAVGDAAGLVDPVTGEGLYYALRSADLVCDAIAAAAAEKYSAALRAELLPELVAASRYANRFYSRAP